MNVIKDSDAVFDVVNGYHLNKFYSKIYFNSNENIQYLFKNIEFKDKNVFSVLGSSDQLILAKSLGAKKIDTFDINRLTLYYYYLRKWCIEYDHLAYPYPLLDNNYIWLNRLVNFVEIKSENEANAIKFWKRLIRRKVDFKKLFIRDNEYKSMSDSQMSDLVNYNISFDNIDFSDDVNIDKKYDIVILSNIIEWYLGNNRKVSKIKDNLVDIVKDDGIVICSNLNYRTIDDIGEERDLFFHDFSCEDVGYNVGYVYKKNH